MAKLRPEQLEASLSKSLASAYLISGEEPLLIQEACDSIRRAARQAGFSERELYHADAGFDWNQLLASANNLSLFAERKILEVRMPSGKPGDKGTKALQEYLAQPSEDNLLLLVTDKLDKTALSSKWCKAMEDTGIHVQIWPISPAQLPRWIGQRLQQAGLRADSSAIDLLAARVEGNLLAAAQEVEKLKLLAEGNQVDAETVQAAVADSARFDVFGLIDCALGGDAAHALRMLEGLRGEGVETPVILWALAREIRLLAGIAHQQSQGIPLDKAFSSARPPVWDKRRPLVSKALQRHSSKRWGQLLQQAQLIDAQIKGQAPGDPWSELALLTLQLAGQRLRLNP